MDEDEREAKDFKEKSSLWRKDTKVEKGKKNRYYYRTVQEVIEKGKKSSSILGDRFR